MVACDDPRSSAAARIGDCENPERMSKAKGWQQHEWAGQGSEDAAESVGRIHGRHRGLVTGGGRHATFHDGKGRTHRDRGRKQHQEWHQERDCPLAERRRIDSNPLRRHATHRRNQKRGSDTPRRNHEFQSGVKHERVWGSLNWAIEKPGAERKSGQKSEDGGECRGQFVSEGGREHSRPDQLIGEPGSAGQSDEKSEREQTRTEWRGSLQRRLGLRSGQP